MGSDHVSYKQMVSWVASGVCSVIVIGGGFFAWAWNIHGAHPHSGSVTEREFDNLAEDVRILRVDVKDISTKQDTFQHELIDIIKEASR